MINTTPISRRAFLNGLFASSASLLIPSSETVERFFKQYGACLKRPEISLSFYNTHTGETVRNCVVWAGDQLVAEGLSQIKHLFRDPWNNKQHDIDPNLIRLLHQIYGKLEVKEPIHLISGYRSLQTNEALRSKGDGVAQNSQHLYGKAADIAIPGCSLAQIKKAALSLKGGGVGCYSQFVHIDTGAVRVW